LTTFCLSVISVLLLLKIPYLKKLVSWKFLTTHLICFTQRAEIY
jgi:hypothetical protein